MGYGFGFGVGDIVFVEEVDDVVETLVVLHSRRAGWVGNLNLEFISL